MTQIRLALSIQGSDPKFYSAGLTDRGRTDPLDKPSILVAFPYLKIMDKSRPLLDLRSWVMDSGAFSALNSGVKIDLDEYIETCQERLELDDKLEEVFALDVIGDWRATLRNTEKMWEAGVPAIPTFHAGSPEDVLMHIAKHYPKIAISGSSGLSGKARLEYAVQCFGRVWPKPIHGFAMVGDVYLQTLPFDSVDSSSWQFGPRRFGTWKSYGYLGVRGSYAHYLDREVDYYLNKERLARSKWRRELLRLHNPDADPTPAVRWSNEEAVA